MPASGSSQDASLGGLWPSKAQQASPRCAGPPSPTPQPSPPRQKFQRSPARGPHPVAWAFAIGQRILGLCLLWPAAWLSGCLCIAWLCLSWPLTCLNWLLGRAPTGGRRPCVLVSGGSTVQAVHLARNLRRCGARVVVCELEGLFGLARFSTACARYYSLPRPQAGSAAAYVAALRMIVLRERCTNYLPVSASCGAYYDALARPHLELLGCECLVPGAGELAELEDPVRLLRRAAALGLPTPRHRLLAGLEEAARLYAAGAPRPARYLALAAGPTGMRDRPELRLALSLPEFQQQARSVPEPGRQWLLLEEPAGAQLVTCTTVRESRLLANVTCRVDETRGALLPERRPEVTRWLERLLAQPGPRFTGHLNFRLAASEDRPGELVALGCRAGLGLAYLGHSQRQAALLLQGRATRAPGQALEEAPGRPLDKGEALFACWDPLPYCVYRYLQLPLRRMQEILGARHQPPLAVVE